MPPAVIAHRGASGTHPENTLPAFVRAVALGAAMIELDVQLTRDDAVVVIHDATVNRTTDGVGPVRHHTLADLQRLDAGTWFGSGFRDTRVPTLAEVLEAIPLPINVELKPDGGAGLEERTLAVVADAGALQRVVFSSFAATRLDRLRALSSTADLAVLEASTNVERALACAQRVRATAVHIRKSRSAPMGIAAGHAKGLAVRVWTVNAPRDFACLAEAGVDAVFTDFPERFLQPGGA